MSLPESPTAPRGTCHSFSAAPGYQRCCARDEAEGAASDRRPCRRRRNGSAGVVFVRGNDHLEGHGAAGSVGGKWWSLMVVNDGEMCGNGGDSGEMMVENGGWSLMMVVNDGEMMVTANGHCSPLTQIVQGVGYKHVVGKSVY